VLRTALGAAAAGAAIALAAPAGPAFARDTDPVAGLAVHPEWGSVIGHGGVLRHGCKSYTFDYDIHPPTGTWLLEVFIVGPRGEHLGNGASIDGYDPERGTTTYKLCRRTTEFGRFTIEGKLSTQDADGNTSEGQLPPDHYRLRHPHHHHRHHH
jgi:hypothetical protein